MIFRETLVEPLTLFEIVQDIQSWPLTAHKPESDRPSASGARAQPKIPFGRACRRYRVSQVKAVMKALDQKRETSP